MAENMSLADQAVQALSMVKAMDDGIDNDMPHRHIVRGMKRVAEQKIAAALREAIDLAWMAQELPRLVDGVRLRTMKELADAEPVDNPNPEPR